MLVTEQIRTGDVVTVRGTFESRSTVGMIEVIKNGEVAQSIQGQPEAKEKGGQRIQFETKIPLDTTAWIAVRGFEGHADQRPRFAHTAPVHHTVEDQPLRPRKEDVAYLIKRVEDELTRHQGVLPETALAEYQESLDFYRFLHDQAR